MSKASRSESKALIAILLINMILVCLAAVLYVTHDNASEPAPQTTEAAPKAPKTAFSTSLDFAWFNGAWHEDSTNLTFTPDSREITGYKIVADNSNFTFYSMTVQIPDNSAQVLRDHDVDPSTVANYAETA